MSGDEESVFDRLWEMIRERFRIIDQLLGFIVPLRIIRRAETLTILDYRPTLLMFFTGAGFLFFAAGFFVLLFSFGITDPFILSVFGLIAVACAVLFLFRGTIREVYYFDRTTGSYTFIRQFIHRREVIEGDASQFTGAYVKTVTDDESESYFVVLQQEGMFLTGETEQKLREDVPIFNSYDRELRIAEAIRAFIPSKRKA